jgi:hypothetical protein
MGALDVLDGDAYPLTGTPVGRAVGEAAQPDLRPLEVGEDGDVAVGRLCGLAHLAEAPAVLGVLAVAEVQPGDVHAGLDERAYTLRRVRGRPEGADDLGATCHGDHPTMRT